MNIEKIREILDIVEKHRSKSPTAPTSPFSGAAHEVIFLELSLDQVSEDDKDGKRLIALGCSIDDTDTTWCIRV